ncbi:hypothetical protein BT69DRAFT_496696 [Atractiella rhizophila]|nr:hypothetical protein BT69DRAFT_496696 [Atractiella rhizophila]
MVSYDNNIIFEIYHQCCLTCEDKMVTISPRISYFPSHLLIELVHNVTNWSVLILPFVQ